MGKEQDVLDYVKANAPAGDAEAVIACVDAYTAAGKRMMNLGPNKSRILDRALENSGAKRILELGSFFGYSATRMAWKAGAEASVITVDADPTRHRVSGELVAHAGLAERVTLLLGKAEDVIPTLTGHFDLVFIDHYADNYRKDLEAVEARGLLAPGATVVADNVIAHLPAVQPYLDHVRDSGLYSSTLHPVGRDGVEVSIWKGR